MRKWNWPRGRRTPTIPYQGKLWSRTDLAEHLGLGVNQLSARIDRGWPESRWGEPIQEKYRKKPDKLPKPRTRAERENMMPYSEAELLVLYRFFAGEEDELTKLADFMVSDREAAEELLWRWRFKGLI